MSSGFCGSDCRPPISAGLCFLHSEKFPPGMQKQWGKCGKEWLLSTVGSAFGYCAMTCGRCSCNKGGGQSIPRAAFTPHGAGAGGNTSSGSLYSNASSQVVYGRDIKFYRRCRKRDCSAYVLEWTANRSIRHPRAVFH